MRKKIYNIIDEYGDTRIKWTTDFKKALEACAELNKEYEYDDEEDFYVFEKGWYYGGCSIHNIEYDTLDNQIITLIRQRRNEKLSKEELQKINQKIDQLEQQQIDLSKKHGAPITTVEGCKIAFYQDIDNETFCKVIKKTIFFKD